jgi:hypothetical protein
VLERYVALLECDAADLRERKRGPHDAAARPAVRGVDWSFWLGPWAPHTRNQADLPALASPTGGARVCNMFATSCGVVRSNDRDFTRRLAGTIL